MINHELRWYRGLYSSLVYDFFVGGNMRKFEKISYPEFVKVFGDNKTLYDDYMLPLRGTKCSAGYDFFAIKDYVIKPNEIVKIPTGYKATFESDEMLMIVVRSSMGFKYNVRLTNQVGIIESDYYNNRDNEGHIYLQRINLSSFPIKLQKGECVAQGIICPYGLTEDDIHGGKRMGGHGSTTT